MKILVCGDAMQDIYWYGKVTRISPEAPVPVAQIQAVQIREGGAANVARNIEAMYEKPLELYSPSYPDEAVSKIRIVSRGQQLVRADFDQGQAPIDLKAFQSAVADGNPLVVLSDYGKGALANVQELIAAAKRAGCWVLVDPKGRKYDKYIGANLIKPNLKELEDIVGPWESEIELQAKVDRLRIAMGGPMILLTRGPEGMTLFAAEKVSFPSEAQEVYDVSGAGDTAMAALAAATARGCDILTAVRYANKAAGLACRHFGTSIIQGKDIFDEAAHA